MFAVIEAGPWSVTGFGPVGLSLTSVTVGGTVMLRLLSFMSIFGHGVTGRMAAGPEALGVFKFGCVRSAERGNRGIGNQRGVLGPGGRGHGQGREDDEPGARSGEAAEPGHGAAARRTRREPGTDGRSPNRRARVPRRAMTPTPGSAPQGIAATARPSREPAAMSGLPRNPPSGSVPSRRPRPHPAAPYRNPPVRPPSQG